MKNKNLRHILRKINIIKLAVLVLVLSAAVALMFLNPMDKKIKVTAVDDISKIEELYSSGSHYIQYTADSLYYSGVDYSVNGKIKAKVYYRLEAGRCYFFIISADKAPDTNESPATISLNARLIYNDNMYRSIIASLSDSIDFSLQGLEAVSSSILISQYGAYGFGTYYTAALLIVCVILGAALVIRIFMIIFPPFSPSALYLGRYGIRKELFAAACEEFSAAAPPRVSGLYVTERFIFHITSGFADIIPIENITWIYTSNEIRHFHGTPRINSTLCILTESRRTYKIRRISKKIAADIISELQTKCPSIMADVSID